MSESSDRLNLIESLLLQTAQSQRTAQHQGNVLDVWKRRRIKQVVFSQFAYSFGTCSLPRLWQ